MRWIKRIPQSRDREAYHGLRCRLSTPVTLFAGRVVSRDRVYSEVRQIVDFVFDDAVVAVFPDMIRRSVPGYETVVPLSGLLAARHAAPGGRCYDLGCSLGAATLAMRQGIGVTGCRIIAVDNAPAMIQRCRALIAADDGEVEVHIIEDDVQRIDISRASMVVMNYTLQFLPAAGRDAMIRKIHDGMIDGGIFVLSEKVVHEDPDTEALLVGMHHEFKRSNAYSDLEISRKRLALEDVLVPESIPTHRARLANAGFRHVEVWLKHFNFVSLIAIP